MDGAGSSEKQSRGGAGRTRSVNAHCLQFFAASADAEPGLAIERFNGAVKIFLA